MVYKRKLLYILTLVSVFLSGCSPFGNETVIGSIGNLIDQIFQGKASTEVNTGGTQQVETNPGNPAQNYKLSLSVGGQTSQTAVNTNGGYKVYTTVQSSLTE
ncbi:MAG: hypothetical protein AABY53_09865 [Bdellovibrionota bacterium]